MKTRVISGAVLLIVFGAACFTGGGFLWGLLLAASLIGTSEFSGALLSLKDKVGKKLTLPEITAWSAIIVYYLVIFFNFSERSVVFVLLLSLAVMICVYVLSYPKYTSGYAMGMFFSVIYIGVCLSCVYLVRAGDDGLRLVWLVFISSWICDTGAYFTGCALGKHKLSPILSPKKTIEGSVGGVLASVCVGGVYGFLTGNSPFILALIAGAGAVLSQFGDLFASAVKREHEIKDYGKLIPGHGGILDRFDSVIVTAPVIYVLSALLMKG